MGFLDNMKDFWSSFTGDDYDYDEPQRPALRVAEDVYATASTASTAPDYAAQTSAVPEQVQPRPMPVPDPVISTLALLIPERLSSVREAADHLLKNHAIILNMSQTEPDMARRWLDYLSGTAYSCGGQIRRIATRTYLVTPQSIFLEGDFSE